MKILLAWETVEETTYYLLEGLSAEDIALLESANGKYINGDEDVEDVTRIGDYLSCCDKYCQVEGAPHNCKWHNTKVTTPIREPIGTVYNCGFYG